VQNIYSCLPVVVMMTDIFPGNDVIGREKHSAVVGQWGSRVEVGIQEWAQMAFMPAPFVQRMGPPVIRNRNGGPGLNARVGIVHSPIILVLPCRKIATIGLGVHIRI
jgi:hypothetical protein